MGQDATMVYSGYFERSLDAKKRTAVPSSWLTHEEGEVFHVAPHPSEPFLMVMPPAEFDRWEQRIQDSNLSPADKRKAIRKFYSDAQRVTTDKQGRILLNDKHCERLGLSGEVAFVGVRSRFEIWSKQQYNEADGDQTEAYKRVAEDIGL